ncbi:hypothetical protein A0W34_30380 (plasmid) [Rhodococcus sp. BH4]|uniref:TetR/AcrR family transcriptional regulator n=1 Tax=Rhodococcus sp. BH4 TaxID=1807790 RepID=UPI0009C1C94E|nr:TetR/AcrR family transcriptional regulator [Rhodococcus sp. BH4]ARE37827.1 hypothetical protein A0W34_30380 [Rhodococcus sp. BH4]
MTESSAPKTESLTVNTEDLVISGGRQLRRIAKPRRQASYDDEVRVLIHAAQQVMAEKGRSAQPKVADIVGAAGMSNQAFYRHFRSRDDVIVATYEQGLLAVAEYLDHRIGKVTGSENRVRAWIEGVLNQIEDPDLSELSGNILWNVNQINRGSSEIEPVGHTRILRSLSSVLTAGGIAEPEQSALLVQTLVMGITSRHMEFGHRPTSEEREALVQFCLQGLGPLDD